MMRPAWISRLDWRLIKAKSDKFLIHPHLIAAVIMTESSGRADAVRYEHNYKYLYEVKENARRLGISVDAETYAQKCSYSLGQVMGAVAREFGHRGPLQDLLVPQIGLEFACRKLEWCLEKWPLWDDACAAYNGGSPRKDENGFLEPRLQKYVDHINGYLRDLEGFNLETKTLS